MRSLPAWVKADDDKLRTIEAEMLRLQQRIDAWRAAWNGPEPGTFPRESGAVRRATMDLTRALADYRRRGGRLARPPVCDSVGHHGRNCDDCRANHDNRKERT